jgi:hypothetical protein
MPYSIAPNLMNVFLELNDELLQYLVCRWASWLLVFGMVEVTGREVIVGKTSLDIRIWWCQDEMKQQQLTGAWCRRTLWMCVSCRRIAKSSISQVTLHSRWFRLHIGRKVRNQRCISFCYTHICYQIAWPPTWLKYKFSD